jgi:hypothetical protein
MLGDTVFELRFSRSGQFHRHLDTGQLQNERLRLSGRHLRFVMRRKPWDDITEEERFERLRDHVWIEQRFRRHCSVVAVAIQPRRVRAGRS